MKTSLSEKEIYELALTTENLQHGDSSGLDLKLSLHGGIHRYQNKCLTPLKIATLPFQTINSGKPQSTTGECVTFVKQQKFSESIWYEFEKTTRAFVTALQNNDKAELINAIKKNHRLLCAIGVVPQPIQAMIAKIEKKGGAAKICGAGSIQGDYAGMILITDNAPWPDAIPLSDMHRGAYIS